ncbi:MAG: lipoprotein [Anderseniella sp.]
MDFRKLIIFIMIAVSLAACGKKGALEPPPGVAAPDPDEPAAIDPLIKSE